MCLLNGELGGSFGSEVNFGEMEIEDKYGNLTIEKIPLYTIIRNMVHDFGGESFSNIIINDLDIVGYELLSYKGTSPYYLLIEKETGLPFNVYQSGTTVFFKGNKVGIDSLDHYYVLDPLMDSQNDDASVVTLRKETTKSFYVVKIEYGQTAGYHEVELTYHSDLIAKVGENVASILEKIKQMLSNYEYFYDLDGRFIFQQNKTYVNSSYRPGESDLYEPMMAKSQYNYIFEDYALIISINDTPQITNLKNDFSVWGEKTINDVKYPIHIRYAIDKKPTKYTSLSWTSLSGINYPSTEYTIKDYDWRELIYQMATDYYRMGTEPDFRTRVQQNNPWCMNGKTGYEQYYQDIQGFWRQLYDPFVEQTLIQKETLLDAAITEDEKKSALEAVTNAEEKLEQYYLSAESADKRYWNKSVFSAPDSLYFWFDFLDTNGELENISVPKIGDRLKAVSQNTVNVIYNTDVPQVKYNYPDEEALTGESTMEGLIEVNLPNVLADAFDLSTSQVGALDYLSELLYTHVTLPMSFTVTAIPIYYLEPNTRISLADKGDCILSKISYNLSHSGTMSLTCSQVTKQFIKEVK